MILLKEVAMLMFESGVPDRLSNFIAVFALVLDFVGVVLSCQHEMSVLVRCK